MVGRISELTELTTPATDDEFEIMDQSGTPNNDSRNMRIKIRTLKLNQVNTYTSSQTLTDDNEIVLLNPSTSAMTITLPAASGRTGKRYKFIYVSTTGQPVVIDANASELINGKLTITMEHYLAICEIYCDGSNWYGGRMRDNYDSEDLYLLEDDFIGGNNTAGDIGEAGWNEVGVGTETFAGIDAEADHAGIWRFGTGAISGDDCDIWLGDTQTLNAVMMNNANLSVTFLIRITGTLANATRRYGIFLNAASNNQETNENMCFLFDTAVSAKWRMRTRSSGGVDETTTDGGADVALSTWYKLKIVRDGSTVRFYIDDVNVANHSTQVPTNAGTPTFTIDATSAAARTHDADYFNLRIPSTR